MGLDQYFKLPPWGVDVQRAYELMTTINDEGKDTITDKEGTKLQVKITADLVSAALQMPTPQEAKKLPYQLNETERKKVFKQTFSTKTFKDLVDLTLDHPLRLYAHHFAIGRPHRSIRTPTKG